eukprot:TRINITY_DN3169_c0_g1_i4.p1 TRINITY_DN3169_c0_g1~~TRINITY_DN3169_c0_g1_i4.p1  ORF type:complete len:738 (-),score=219.59 TRINITY_DN3169_c0_g1_i4:48-2261(-)
MLGRRDDAELRGLRDAGEIEREYQRACEGEEALARELRAWHDECLPRLDHLHSALATPPEQILRLKESLQSVNDSVTASCDVAESISSSIHHLDSVRVRLVDTLRKVDDIIDLKNCMKVVRDSLDSGHYEAAANHIRRYKEMEFVLDANSIGLLQRVEHDLLAEVEKHLVEAQAAHDEPSVQRMCKVYGLLGKGELGMRGYTAYIARACNECAAGVKEALSGRLKAARSPADRCACYTEACAALFEGLAAIVEQQASGGPDQPLGTGSIFEVLRGLQNAADSVGRRFVEEFKAQCGVSRAVDDVRQVRRGGVDVDPLVLPPLLEPTALVIQALELFDAFLRQKEKNSIEAHNAAGGQPPAAAQLLKRFSDLNDAAHILLDDYVLMEQFYMEASVRKIMREEQSLVEAVDFVFFILQRCTVRCIITCNADSVCSVINTCGSVLMRDVFQQTVRAYSELAASTAPLKDSAKGQMPFLAIHNCLDQISANVVKLHEMVDAECQRLFKPPAMQQQLPKSDKSNTKSAHPPAQQQGPWVKVKLCLDEFLNVDKTVSAQLREHLEQLCVTQVFPRLRACVDLFTGVNYEIGEDDYLRNAELYDAFVVQFAMGVESLLKQYEGSLTPRNYENVVTITVNYLLEKIEQLFFQKRFTMLGGIQFEKDMRGLNTHFGGLTHKNFVREKFLRLANLALFLQLEKVSDAVDFWRENASASSWHLSQHDVRRAMTLRVDFSKELVTHLRL